MVKRLLINIKSKKIILLVSFSMLAICGQQNTNNENISNELDLWKIYSDKNLINDSEKHYIKNTLPIYGNFIHKNQTESFPISVEFNISIFSTINQLFIYHTS